MFGLREAELGSYSISDRAAFVLGKGKVMQTLHQWFWFYIDMPRRASMIFLLTLMMYFFFARLVGVI